jgi:hypothetical protein
LSAFDAVVIMEVNKSHIIVGCSALVIGLIAGLLLRGCSGSELPEDPEPIVLHDTISVHDTAYIAKHTKPKEVVRWDTIYLPGNDKTNDTTDAYALIPITQSEYRDTFATDSTRAEIAVLFSGYNAKIDSVGLTYEATIQPKVYVKKKGWGQFVGIGVGAGYGASVVGSQVYAAPQIGISIVYGFGYHW